MDIVDVKEFVTLEGKRQYVWRTIPATAARRLAEPRLRCPVCFGAVVLFAASLNNRMPERGEHKSKNTGCSLSDKYDGKSQRIHPIAIEPEQKSINAHEYGN